MNDLISWLRAILTEEESRAERMEHATDSSEAYSCPATRDYPLGDLAYGEANCTCNLTARKARALRQVQAHRAILAAAFGHMAKVDGEWGCCHGADAIERGHCPEQNPADDEIIKALVSIYSDRDGYKEEWLA